MKISAATWLSYSSLGRGLDPDHAFRTVDHQDHLGLRLALDLQRVEAAELHQRSEVAAHVAVDRDAGQRRERDDERLAGAGGTGCFRPAVPG